MKSRIKHFIIYIWKYKYTPQLYKSQKVAKRKKLGIWKNYSAAFPEESSQSNSNSSNSNSPNNTSSNTPNYNSNRNTSNTTTGSVWVST